MVSGFYRCVKPRARGKSQKMNRPREWNAAAPHHPNDVTAPACRGQFEERGKEEYDCARLGKMIRIAQMQTFHRDLLFLHEHAGSGRSFDQTPHWCNSCGRFTHVPQNLVPAAKRNTKTIGEQRE